MPSDLVPTALDLGKLQPEKSMKAVCHCGKDRAECPDCNAGYNQEITAGRQPKLVNPEDVVAEPESDWVHIIN